MPYPRISADYLIENFVRDDATSSTVECVNVEQNILASVESPEDPLSRIKGVCAMDSCFFVIAGSL